ncbi:chorismate mutase [Streptomyces sp. NPDC014995]|uniref:chorismate mutase n=1 Tax=Streptomyces sp. NPDC014995 TaxID=3364936 RepID=UPI0036F50A97
MRIPTPLRGTLIAAAATAALLTAPGTAATAAPSSSPSPPYASSPSFPSLRPVVALSAERLATADLVAAAKWGTDTPIDDPARERQVLDTVAAQAERAGADPDEVRRIFRDQIEANKAVQRGLFRRWTTHPDQAPTTRPDLSVVRETINRVTTDLVAALAATTPERTAPACHPRLAVATLQVRHEQHPDALHTRALVRSLASVCR